PNSPSGEDCMGCGWNPPGYDFAKTDAVEIANGGGLRAFGIDDRVFAFNFWYGLLDKGFHPTAIGGSDNHDADASDGIGTPTTVVYAAELSQPAILDGIKAGHVFIDVEGTKDRLLEIKSGGAMMGDQVPGKAAISVHVHGVPGGHVEIVKDGVVEKDG